MIQKHLECRSFLTGMRTGHLQVLTKYTWNIGLTSTFAFLCISQGADTAWRRGEETRRWCEESWSRRIVHIFRMIKINKVPHCSVYWDTIVYVIMNVSDKRWKGEGASHPGWTPQAHYVQTIADRGPCCLPDNRFHHFWLFAIKSLYATASMNDGEVGLNPCIFYAEVIHSSSRIRCKWHRCETQNMNTGELGSTHNKAKFFWLFVMMAAMVQMRVMSARHCRFTWKVLIWKDFMSDTLIRLQSPTHPCHA